MPTFSNIEFDFEVYCASCGAGICNNADTRESRRRGHPQVTIEPCETCLESAREKASEEKEREMNKIIEQLREEIEDLKTQEELP